MSKQYTVNNFLTVSFSTTKHPIRYEHSHGYVIVRLPGDDVSEEQEKKLRLLPFVLHCDGVLAAVVGALGEAAIARQVGAVADEEMKKEIDPGVEALTVCTRTHGLFSGSSWAITDG